MFVCICAYFWVRVFVYASCGSRSGCSCTVRQAEVLWGWRNTRVRKQQSSRL